MCATSIYPESVYSPSGLKVAFARTEAFQKWPSQVSSVQLGRGRLGGRCMGTRPQKCKLFVTFGARRKKSFSSPKNCQGAASSGPQPTKIWFPVYWAAVLHVYKGATAVLQCRVKVMAIIIMVVCSKLLCSHNRLTSPD